MRSNVIEAKETKPPLWSGVFNNRVGPSTNHIKETGDYGKRLDLLYEVGKKVGSVPKLSQLIEQIMKMTQHTLKVSASSLLLIDDGKQELFFKFATGQSAKALNQVKLSSQSGIAGWVARQGKPLIVNDVTKDGRFDREIDETTGFVTKSIVCAPMVVGRKTIGVIEVLNKLDGSDFSEHDLETTVSVASTAAMAIENTRLHQTVLDAYRSTIRALTATIDAKDRYTCGHSQRVTAYALLGGKSLSLPQEKLEVLEYAGILHDIGKIGVADSVLLKPVRLTPEEWDIIRQHPVTGANIIDDVPFLKEAKTLVLHHHEKYDGTGYPDGLKGEDIPLGARLLAAADAFDSMTTGRRYRAALGVVYALSELRRYAGTQFCPVAVEAFISGFNRCRHGIPHAQS